MKRSRGFTLVELLVVVGIIAMLIGILMPTLGRALDYARIAMCAANLNAIGKGLILYQTENDDQFPPDLVKLVESQVIPAEMLMSPSSGRKVRKDSKGKPIGPFDYVYLGAGLKTTDIPNPENLILVYERPEINKFRGTNVLYADGHVAWVTMEKFRRDLAKTQEWIKNKDRGGKDF